MAGPGVGALLAQLVWALCAEGEGVLMATVSPIRLGTVELMGSRTIVCPGGVRN